MKKQEAYDNLKAAITAPRKKGRIKNIKIALAQYENASVPWWKKRLFGQNPATSNGRTVRNKASLRP